MSGTPVSDNEESSSPILKVQVIGGSKDRAVEGFTQHLLPQEEPRVYRTWFNIHLLSRLENLFKDGVESAGGLFEIVCMFFVAIVIIGFVLLSQLLIFSIVVAVLALFSGGASLKFFRTTYIETPSASVSSGGAEKFVSEMLTQGSLVSIDSEDKSFTAGSIVKQSNRVTKAYLYGINTCQFIAMVFVLVEVLHYLLLRSWFVDWFILGIFGLVFLVGIILMDVGVLMRHKLVKSLQVES